MTLLLGAYAASPNVTGWDPTLETAYYQQLKTLPQLSGLEHPFTGNLHPHDDSWFLANIDPAWNYVFTTIPGVMNALAQNPRFGLASTDQVGRQAAIDFMQLANQAIAKLNQHLGRQAVSAIMLHSAPARQHASSSEQAFQASLTTLLSWDWHGASVLLEHCDALLPGQKPSKGFLSLEQELSVLADLNQTLKPERPLGVVINWGRSVLETRTPDGALAHLQAAKAQGLLKGLMFSGISDKANAYGAWQDSHQPAQSSELVPFGEPGSWLTEEAIQQCLFACAGADLTVLGLKIGIRPLTASLAERINYLRAQLAILVRHRVSM
ncbi:DUF4862 domain-containing protein [Alishewanella longhuensis]|uniref:DUF4862 domain-containing protein n=1 Tax=Alishewanella longhuensis TaxID=1091037 RepID=A0ABQ3L058_9ALTE|nr:DUF4862 family protein [Alishewanella longhuensis]GHG72449.1 DUF4862 domain-containing protein [Alishewanella longhuensis]